MTHRKLARTYGPKRPTARQRADLERYRWALRQAGKSEAEIDESIRRQGDTRRDRDRDQGRE